MEERFSFGMLAVRAGSLDRHRKTLESFGFTCTVEVTFETHHKFELHTLVATLPERPTRVERGCFMST